MDIHNRTETLPPSARGAVVAIGNFDGVHLGHQAVIGTARAKARELAAPLGVMTFEPHPRGFFAPATPPFRLTPMAAKARALASLGVDHLYVIGFDRDFAARTAGDFIAGVLARDLGAVAVAVGGDFAFGRGREGNLALLEREAPAFGIAVVRVAPAAVDGVPVSSRRIRELLSLGKVDEAARLLGRPWELEGPIVHGDKLGRTFGYPTANIDLDDYLRPRVGIYAVEASLDENGRAGPWMGGVASLGFRPTVGGSDLRFEVHLFDFSADIYGRRLRVRPVRYLRDEMKLDGTGALIRQMREDEAEARAILATRAEVDAGAAIKNKSGKNKSGAAPGRGSR